MNRESKWCPICGIPLASPGPYMRDTLTYHFLKDECQPEHYYSDTLDLFQYFPTDYTALWKILIRVPNLKHLYLSVPCPRQKQPSFKQRDHQRPSWSKKQKSLKPPLLSPKLAGNSQQTTIKTKVSMKQRLSSAQRERFKYSFRNRIRQTKNDDTPIIFTKNFPVLGIDTPIRLPELSFVRVVQEPHAEPSPSALIGIPFDRLSQNPFVTLTIKKGVNIPQKLDLPIDLHSCLRRSGIYLNRSEFGEAVRQLFATEDDETKFLAPQKVFSRELSSTYAPGVSGDDTEFTHDDEPAFSHDALLATGRAANPRMPNPPPPVVRSLSEAQASVQSEFATRTEYFSPEQTNTLMEELSVALSCRQLRSQSDDENPAISSPESTELLSFYGLTDLEDEDSGLSSTIFETPADKEKRIHNNLVRALFFKIRGGSGTNEDEKELCWKARQILDSVEKSFGNAFLRRRMSFVSRQDLRFLTIILLPHLETIDGKSFTRWERFEGVRLALQKYNIPLPTPTHLGIMPDMFSETISSNDDEDSADQDTFEARKDIFSNLPSLRVPLPQSLEHYRMTGVLPHHCAPVDPRRRKRILHRIEKVVIDKTIGKLPQFNSWKTELGLGFAKKSDFRTIPQTNEEIRLSNTQFSEWRVPVQHRFRQGRRGIRTHIFTNTIAPMMYSLTRDALPVPPSLSRGFYTTSFISGRHVEQEFSLPGSSLQHHFGRTTCMTFHKRFPFVAIGTMLGVFVVRSDEPSPQFLSSRLRSSSRVFPWSIPFSFIPPMGRQGAHAPHPPFVTSLDFWEANSQAPYTFQNSEAHTPLHSDLLLAVDNKGTFSCLSLRTMSLISEKVTDKNWEDFNTQPHRRLMRDGSPLFSASRFQISAPFPLSRVVATTDGTPQCFMCGKGTDIFSVDLARGEVLTCFRKAHSQAHVDIVCIDQNPHLFFSTSSDKFFKIWDTRVFSDKPVIETVISDSLPMQISIDPTGNLFSIANVDGSASIFETKMLSGSKLNSRHQPPFLELPTLTSYTIHSRPSTTFLAMGKLFAVGSSENSTIRVFDTTIGKIFREISLSCTLPISDHLEGCSGNPRCMALSAGAQNYQFGCLTSAFAANPLVPVDSDCISVDLGLPSCFSS
eukprot:gnl/Chilomastix_cuspidata/4288.p1 GENE.gnl/Chilomastix_cuspidata/4288~~gnl/Chilomastix_cuspidata/4288.p1  ORF type:complete len:1121 (-),score=153.24 gnl/Chilomastix_cuspidata/4288:81-3443(-)